MRGAVLFHGSSPRWLSFIDCLRCWTPGRWRMEGLPALQSPGIPPRRWEAHPVGSPRACNAWAPRWGADTTPPTCWTSARHWHLASIYLLRPQRTLLLVPGCAAPKIPPRLPCTLHRFRRPSGCDLVASGDGELILNLTSSNIEWCAEHEEAPPPSAKRPVREASGAAASAPSGWEGRKWGLIGRA